MEVPLLVPHPEGVLCRPSRAEFLKQKRDSGPFGGSETRFGKRPKATGRNCAAGPFMQESGKRQGVKCGWLFWAPAGPGPIRKRQFGRHAKIADKNGSNTVRLYKCHVRREKGPIRGPGGPSVTAQGAHVSPRHSLSGAETKQIKVPVEPPEAVSIPQVTFMF